MDSRRSLCQDCKHSALFKCRCSAIQSLPNLSNLEALLARDGVLLAPGKSRIHHCLVLHLTKLEDSMSPWPLSSILNTSMTGDFSRFRIRHVPSVLITVWSPDLISTGVHCLERVRPTFKEGCGKVDANISIPTSSTLAFDLARQSLGL